MTSPIPKRPDRRVGHMQGSENGPTLVFFAGIHGNEMAGVKAMERVFEALRPHSGHLKGTLIGFRGNIPAQRAGKRFLEHDLNRLWTHDNVESIMAKLPSARSIEERELVELYQELSQLLATQSPPFYFIDFHTTSSKTLPFITINDALINRSFSRFFPVPTILGIEEYLEGPLLSYMNQKGYVSLGFESGQHNAGDSIENSIAFMWLALIGSGLLHENDVPGPGLGAHFRQLQRAAKGNARFYEVTYRHSLTNRDRFKMVPGLESFQELRKGTLIGFHDRQEIKAKKDTIIFMPLYQQQGEEGFFLIKGIPSWALRASVFLRKIRMETFLTLLPGISWSDGGKERLLVNTSIARFLAKSFFHLLGYRNRTIDADHRVMHNRERQAKNHMYRKEWWFGSSLLKVGKPSARRCSPHSHRPLAPRGRSLPP